MLSDQEKQEMLEDAQSESRRRDFAQARERSLTVMTGPEYVQFLENIARVLPHQQSSHKILGQHFKL